MFFSAARWFRRSFQSNFGSVVESSRLQVPSDAMLIALIAEVGPAPRGIMLFHSTSLSFVNTIDAMYVHA